MNGRTNVTTGTNTDILEVPLDSVANFVAEEGTGKVLLSWKDPKDKYATPEGEMAQDPQQLVSVWSHTVIVRKEGSDPVDENDGVVVISSSVRNQYESTQYTDANVSNGIEYHYGAFAINEDGIASDGVYSSATPRVYDTVLANNTWAQIDEACSLGIAESFWEIGDTHTVTIDEEIYTVNIIDFNHDDLADGSGKAAITFCSEGLTTFNESYHQSKYGGSDSVKYANSSIYSTIKSKLYDKMDDKIQPFVKNVNKLTGFHAIGFSISHENASPLEHYTFPFSEIEVAGSIDHSGSSGEGYQYPYFTTIKNRIKLRNGIATTWLLRSQLVNFYSSPTQQNHAYYAEIYTDGTVVGPMINNSNTGLAYSDNYQQSSLPLCFGFCIGKSAA